ncbi:MAG: alpha/beta hydrolase, partial [Oleiharenicola lentus]
MLKRFTLLLLAAAAAVTMSAKPSPPELIRVSYRSAKMNAERDYFVYLPRGFKQQDKWPVMLFLHGNGERGDGKGELDYVLKHGPLFEAWCQKRDLPFIIISPQMPMYDQGEVSYIKNRTRAEIPQRLATGLNPYPPHYTGKDAMEGQLAELPTREFETDPRGWNTIADEVMGMVDTVL